MTLDAADWENLGSVFKAGSDYAFGFEYNATMQNQARCLRVMAERCEEIATALDEYNEPCACSGYENPCGKCGHGGSGGDGPGCGCDEG